MATSPAPNAAVKTTAAKTAATTTAAALEIKLIQIGRRALGLDTETYRALLGNLTGGKTSSKALTERERKVVLDHMKARGFVVKPKPGSAGAAESGWQRAPSMRKLRAMWYLLADAGHVDRPADVLACNAAVEAWAKRQLSTHLPPLAALRFASGEQIDKLINAMKAWCARLGLPVR